MAAINIEDVADKMIGAAKNIFKDKWPEVRNFAASETNKFAQSMAEIEAWKARGEITEEQAKALSRLHQRSMKMVYTSLEGISLAIAENAVNAALSAVRKTINTAIGWTVI